VKAQQQEGGDKGGTVSDRVPSVIPQNKAIAFGNYEWVLFLFLDELK
jgi:chlorite dismutase